MFLPALHPAGTRLPNTFQTTGTRSTPIFSRIDATLLGSALAVLAGNKHWFVYLKNMVFLLVLFRGRLGSIRLLLKFKSLNQYYFPMFQPDLVLLFT